MWEWKKVIQRKFQLSDSWQQLKNTTRRKTPCHRLSLVMYTYYVVNWMRYRQMATIYKSIGTLVSWPSQRRGLTVKVLTLICGGGVCLFINRKWCKSVVAQGEVQYVRLTLKCWLSLRLYYLPREFLQLVYSVEYIHPRANEKNASKVVLDVVN